MDHLGDLLDKVDGTSAVLLLVIYMIIKEAQILIPRLLGRRPTVEKSHQTIEACQQDVTVLTTRVSALKAQMHQSLVQVETVLTNQDISESHHRRITRMIERLCEKDGLDTK